jgi:hypothetical protein
MRVQETDEVGSPISTAMWSHAKSKLRGALGALGPLHFSRRPKKEEKPKDVSGIL